MKTGGSLRDTLSTASQACACITFAIAFLAVLGWASGLRILARLSSELIPMAPGTALALMLVSCSVVAVSRMPSNRFVHRFALVSGLFACLAGSLIFAQYVGDFDLGMERVLYQDGETFGVVEMGRMSPTTALVLILTGLSLISLIIPPTKWRVSREIAASLGMGVAAGGLMAALAYYHGSPLLHGVGLIPMALPTAIAFIFLGCGLFFATSLFGRSLRSLIPVAISLGVAILLCVAVFFTVESLTQANLWSEFERRAGNLSAALQEKVHDNLDRLAVVGRLYGASRDVTRSEFHVFVEDLIAGEGIHAVAWVPRVTDAERESYEEAVRRDGYADFRIRERNAEGQMIGVAPRPEYYPVTYIEPFKGNEGMLGFDLAWGVTRIQALAKARDTGAMVATRSLTLVQDTGNDPAVLIFQPIYRNDTPHAAVEDRPANLLGFAVGVFKVRNLVETALLSYNQTHMVFALYDVTNETPTGKETALYASPEGKTGIMREIFRTSMFDVADRKWSVEVYPTIEFLSSQRAFHALGILMIGLLLTTLLGAYLLASTRHAAESKLATAELMKAMEESGRHAAESIHALESLKSSEERFRSVTESVPDAIILADSTGNIISWNHGAQVIFGYTPEEIVGRPLAVLMPDRLIDAHQVGMERFGPSNESRVVGKTVESAGLRKGGHELPIEMSIATWETEDGRFYGGIVRDISERKRMEEELLTSRKFEATGIIAGGVAHDFNNLLGIVLGNIDMVRLDLEAGSSIKELLDSAAKAALQASHLTRVLLTIPSDETLVKTSSTVKDIVEEAIRLTLGDSEARWSSEMPVDLWKVEVDRGQVAQAISKVLVNANEVTPRDRTIVIAATNIHAEEVIQEKGLRMKQGRYVRISIKDQGPGIPKANLNKIFDPYYSTKDRGSQKGMGLGLSIAYSVVKRHDGYIRVESETGTGTTVSIHLPASG